MKPILEPIHLGKQSSITAFCYSSKNFETPWHYHPQHEIAYIEKSVGTKYIGDYVGSYVPGELVLVRSNLPHCWKNMTDQSSHSKSFVVQWNTGVFAEVPELEGVFKMLSNASKGLLFNNQDVKDLIPIVKKLPELSGHHLYLQLLTLLTELSNCAYETISEASFKDDLPTEYSSRMNRIHDFVQDNFHRRIYLKELAILVSMTEQSFSRFFTKMMGRSFFTFLNEYRINLASRMLTHSDNSVSHIAYVCGYESLPFFHKKFNDAHQISPVKYRNKYKN